MLKLGEKSPLCPWSNFLDQFESFPITPTLRLVEQVGWWSIVYHNEFYSSHLKHIYKYK